MLPEPVRERLRKLLPLLGSPVEGEQLAALSRISSTLKANDLSFHDLVEAVCSASPSTPLVPDGPVMPELNLEPNAKGYEAVPFQLAAVVDFLLKHRRIGSAKEADFLAGMRERCDKFNPVFVSEAQASWLVSIMERPNI